MDFDPSILIKISTRFRLLNLCLFIIINVVVFLWFLLLKQLIVL